ncbi:MAG: hypothetical protein ACFFBP_02255 [Promethearchaeota archaeon]
MSLDKWIKTEKKNDDKRQNKKQAQVSNLTTIAKQDKNIEPTSKLLKKFILNCIKKSCNYQKTVKKRILSDKDMICPRCEGKMEVNEV